MSALSVIVCTHNPRADHLARVMAGLRRQTLPPPEWELIVIDNASTPPLAAAAADGHPAARLVREPRLGTLNARVRGMRESRHELLVFVDDDTILRDDYLAQARAFMQAHPRVGVAGGRIEGVFETPPPRWLKPYLGYLAVRDDGPRPIRRRNGRDPRRMPCTAGMCLRRSVADGYLRGLDLDPRRRALGARGETPERSEDIDLALSAFDAGFEAAYTPALALRHLIPPERFDIAAMERLLEGSAYSTTRLAHFRGLRRKPIWLRRIMSRLRRLPHRRRGDGAAMARMERALDRGEARAAAEARTA